MKAIGYSKSLPVDDPNALVDIKLVRPVPGARDLLVAVNAVSLNPVDVKVRMRAEPETGHKVLGFDAAGIVEEVGAGVSLFKPGDEVFYAGDVTRAGTNAEYHLVDERIVGRKPATLTMAQAAALPLTSITAWEILFDSFKIGRDGGDGETLVIVGGAGGVGSMLIQLARTLTKLKIVATASRSETRDWCLKMGAHEVIDHRAPLGPQIEKLGPAPRYVASLTASEQHFPAIVDLIAPRGEIALIDDPATLAFSKMKPKSLSFHWEFMFARSMFQTADMVEQHVLLNELSDLVDQGRIQTTLTRDFGAITAETLRAAHRIQESGTMIGKLVLAGF